MAAELRRKTPDELLRECQAEEAEATRSAGHLKIMLGYSSGVGKTFRLMDEARRRRDRDVVIDTVQPKLPEAFDALLKKLEIIPLKQIDGAVDAIIQRHPTVCVIDGLAYDNPPDSSSLKKSRQAKVLAAFLLTSN